MTRSGVPGFVRLCKGVLMNTTPNQLQSGPAAPSSSEKKDGENVGFLDMLKNIPIIGPILESLMGFIGPLLKIFGIDIDGALPKTTETPNADAGAPGADPSAQPQQSGVDNEAELVNPKAVSVLVGGVTFSGEVELTSKQLPFNAKSFEFYNLDANGIHPIDDDQGTSRVSLDGLKNARGNYSLRFALDSAGQPIAAVFTNAEGKPVVIGYTSGDPDAKTKTNFGLVGVSSQDMGILSHPAVPEGEKPASGPVVEAKPTASAPVQALP